MAYDDEDEWQPLRRAPRPQFTGELIPADSAREFDEDETIAFFEKLAEGYGPMMIGLGLGWSKAQVDRFVKDPERAQIIDMIAEANNESVEHAIMMFAKAGNSTAMKLWAYNKMTHRGWADRREVRQTVTGQAELVVSVREGVQQATRELIEARGEDGVKALQAAYFSDMLDEAIIEAEVVER